MATGLQRIARPVLTFSAFALLYSTASASWNSLFTSVIYGLQHSQGLPKAPEFSQVPVRQKLSNGRERLARERGGIWTPQTLAADARLQQLRRQKEAMQNPETLLASIAPVISPILATLQEGGGEGGSEAGIPFPSEGMAGGDGLQALAGTREAPLARQWVIPAALKGGTSGGGGGSTGGSTGGGGIDQRNQLNPNTGNFVTYVPIVGWSARGGNYVSFSLFHNSKHPPYSFQDLGARWSHSYAMWVDYDHEVPSTVTLVTPDGMRWPFTRVEDTNIYNPPSGVHGQLQKTDPNGNSSEFKLTVANKEEFHFNDDGYLIKIKDRDNNAVDINRASDNTIQTVDDNTGRSLEFTYTTSGPKRISSVEAPDGQVWQFTYNGSVQMTELKYPVIGGVTPKEQFTYNSTHQILTHKDRLNNTWTYTYTTGTSPMLDTATSPLNKVWDYFYTQSTAGVTDPNGKIWFLSYTGGRIASSADPNGFIEYFTADSAENLTSYIDKRGKTWAWTYSHTHSDPWRRGDVLTAKDPLNRTTTFTYNSNGDMTAAQNPLGQTSSANYYSPGRPYQIKDAANNTQLTFSNYNSYGEVTRTVDAADIKHESTFDSYGNVTESSVISATPNNSPEEVLTTTATYDIMGRVLTTTDTAGETKTLEYDAWGRLVRMYHEDNSYVQLTYDHEDRVISARNELGKTGTRTYNAAGFLTQTSNAIGDVQQYAYDNAGRMTGIKNGRNYWRYYAYTDRGDVSSLTMPDNSVEQWTYDGNGNVTAYTNPLGQVIQYTYNDAGDQTLVNYPAGLDDTSFVYDGAGRLQEMTDATGVSEWEFNTVGKVTKLNTPQSGGDITYSYNVAGQLTSMVEPNVGTTTHTYDKFGRAATLTNPFGETTTWEYDSYGRPFKQIFHDGMYQKNIYDSRSRLEKRESWHPTSGFLMRYQYWYNEANQVVHAFENAKDVYYTYDDIGQLTQEQHSTLGTTISYTYDGNGNRLTRSRTSQTTENYTYDAGDKLTAITGGIDPRTFSYDAAGRTTAIVRGTGTTSFTYDFESRVTSITRPGSLVDNYTYNGLDARVGQTGSSGSKTFKRSGISVTSALLSDGSANCTPGISEKRGSTTTYTHSGLKNTNRQHENGAAVWSGARTYDAFGNDMASGWGTFKGPFGYGGQYGYQEDATGLKLLGHRYYDSSTGRFLTRDPIKDGRNWYGYCYNSPVQFADPTGNIPFLAIFLVGALIMSTSIAHAPTEPITKEVHDAAVARLSSDKANMLLEVATFGKGKPVKAAAGRIAMASKEAAKGGVYVLKRASDGVVVYVGKTISFIRRRNEHSRAHPDTNMEIAVETDDPELQSIFEQLIFDHNGGKDKLRNRYNPIGKKNPLRGKLDDFLDPGTIVRF